MSLKAIIVDDEPVARKVIREYIADIDYLELAGEAENPLRANTLLSEQPVDLLFLDINMPRMNGIEFLRASRRLPPVIITTAYAEYALDGFELDVMDYLVKPIPFDRFLKACNKIRDYYALMRPVLPSASLSDPARKDPAVSNPRTDPGTAAPRGDYFFIKCDSRLEKVMYNELVYAEAMMNYLILHTATKKMIVYLTLKGLLEQLPADRFLRVHKSYIVNLDRIRGIRGNLVDLGMAEVAISQHYYEEAMKDILKDRVIKRE